MTMHNHVDVRHYMAALLMSLLGFFAPWAAYIQLAVGVTPVTFVAGSLLVFWMVVTITRGKFRRPDLADWAASMLLAIIGLSVTWSINSNNWLYYLFYYMLCFATFYVAKAFLRSPRIWKWVVLGFIFGSGFAMTLIGPAESEWGEVLERQSIEGLNSNYVAYVLAGTVSLIFVYAIRFSISLKQWFLVCIFTLLVTYSLTLLGTRSAIASIFLLVVWVFASRFPGRFLLIAIFCAAGSSLFLISLGLLDSIMVLFDVMWADRETGDLSGRLLIWPMARNYISEMPLLGIGAGAFILENPMEMGAHNIILTMLLEAGAIGLVLFMTIVLVSVFPSLRKRASKSSRFAAGAFLCYWTPIALTGHWELAIGSWLILAMHVAVISGDGGNEGRCAT